MHVELPSGAPAGVHDRGRAGAVHDDHERYAGDSDVWASGAATGLVVASCALIAAEARHLTFYLDDWRFVLDRRGFGAGVFLRPHNEHLSAIPVAIYKVLLVVFGATSYAPYMAVLLAFHAATCWLLYVLTRRYIGPWGALVPTAILATLGPAWMDLLWAFQIGFLGSVAAGLGCILCLQRGDRTGDIAGASLLATSLLCSSVGLGFVVVAAVFIALHRPNRWLRLWVVGAPLVLYLLWYAKYGVSDAHSDNIHRLPAYLFDALASAVASGTGVVKRGGSPYLVSLTFGRWLALAFLGFLAATGLRRRGFPAITWACLGGVVVLWIAQCLSGALGGAAREANQSRYQYVPVALLLVAGAGALHGRRSRRWSGAAIAVACLAVCAFNVALLNDRAGFWRSNNTPYTRALTGVLDVSRGVVQPTFMPENFITAGTIGNYSLLLALTAGPYFSARDAFGSPADSPAELAHEPEPAREAADLVLGGAERIATQRAPARAGVARGCAPAHAGENMLRSGILVFAGGPSPAWVPLWRIASRYRYLRLLIPAQEASDVTFPRDRLPLAWHLRLPERMRVRVCAVA